MRASGQIRGMLDVVWFKRDLRVADHAALAADGVAARVVSMPSWYRYEQQGHRTVQVTAYWSVRWSGIGQTGTMAFDFSRTADISIGEVQVINR